MEFVFDRTQADVDRVKELNSKYISGAITAQEKEEWIMGGKGALNISDLNRIEGNMKTISLYFAVTINTKEWKTGDIPKASDYKRILDNLKKIRDAWYALTITPNTPIQPLNHYEKWNEIERILHDFNYTYNRYINSFYYCGSEIYAGDNVGIL